MNINQISFEIFRIKQKAQKEILSITLLKIIGILTGIAMLPIACIFHALGYRYANVFTERIGHLAIEPDCLIKELYLKNKKLRLIMLAPKKKVSNHHLVTYWGKYFNIFYSDYL